MTGHFIHNALLIYTNLEIDEPAMNKSSCVTIASVTEMNFFARWPILIEIKLKLALNKMIPGMIFLHNNLTLY